MLTPEIRPIDQWPEGWPRRRPGRPNPFRVRAYNETLELLQIEARHIHTRRLSLLLDINGADLRRDGFLRAHAQVGYRGLIVVLDTRDLGVLTYPCDTFDRAYADDPPSWQINLRAIALGLEALRKVERYGIAERGQQYAGFGALPPAREAGAAMTADVAERLLREHAGAAGDDSRSWADLWRVAVRHHHPDVGGDPAVFRRLTEARDLLTGAGR